VDTVPEARLVDELRDDGDAVPRLSLVAVVNGAVVGHVLCSRGVLGGRSVLAIAPLAVVPELQRRGVGSALVHAVLGAADALDEPAVVVLGDPSYYSRFGFGPAEPLGILAPEPAWGVHFQARRLHAWDPALTGTYAYPAAFNRL